MTERRRAWAYLPLLAVPFCCGGVAWLAAGGLAVTAAFGWVAAGLAGLVAAAAVGFVILGWVRRGTGHGPG